MRIVTAMKIAIAMRHLEMEVVDLHQEVEVDTLETHAVNRATESADLQPGVVADTQETHAANRATESADLQPGVEVDIQEINAVNRATESDALQMIADTIKMIEAIHVDLNEGSEAEMRRMKIDHVRRD